MYILEVSSPKYCSCCTSLKLTERFCPRQQLARLLDCPFFPWKNVLVGFSLGQFILEGFLSFRQYKVLQRTKPPKVLENEVSQKVFDQSQVSRDDYIAIVKIAGLIFLPFSIGVWSRKSQVWFHLGSLRSNPESCIYLRRCPPQALGIERSLASPVLSLSVSRRDFPDSSVHLRFQPDQHRSVPASFILQHLRSRGEVWLQQADAQALGHRHAQGSDARNCVGNPDHQRGA